MSNKKGNVHKRIARVRLQEAADAVIWVLEEHDKRFPDTTLPKTLLLERIPEAIWKMRTKSGIKYIPTVDNREVAVASKSFVNGNWTEICLKCAEFGYFIIWNPPGGPKGIRLGTLEEYKHQQSQIFAVTSGMARFHNIRSGIITDSHGDESTDIHVEVSKHESANSV